MTHNAMTDSITTNFSSPPDAYTPMPFWFWNDTLEKEVIAAQIQDFYDKGVCGFVIHPRLGLPKDPEYLSDAYMDYVRFAVEEARRRGMKVILYDEAMYPSGSAHGMVVRTDPAYATKCLRMYTLPFDAAGTVTRDRLPKEGRVISVQIAAPGAQGHPVPGSLRPLSPDAPIFRLPKDLVRHAAADDLTGHTATENLTRHAAMEAPTGHVAANDTLTEAGTGPDGDARTTDGYVLLVFNEEYSDGTIRGIHAGEDDHEPDAPKSADLLSDAAVSCFIRLTYDRYYEALGSHFGDTVIGIFTDEPDVLGRTHKKGVKAWTSGFLADFYACGGTEAMLPFLWYEGGAHEEAVSRYKEALHRRMAGTYYGNLSRWCKAHRIALTGHPHESDDIGYMQYFDIPAQDIVWRWVAPEDGKALYGRNSTVGKCSSDAARHRGIRRNASECFGCCGPDGVQWAFMPDDMKWYLDWLFIRGVNLIIPHAFFYSLRGHLRSGERPPDVGPNNIWWPHYRLFSDYIKRMSWLLTDSVNVTDIAVLCEKDALPYEICALLYKRQIEYNYLEAQLLTDKSCRIADGVIRIQAQSYRILIVEDVRILSETLLSSLRLFLSSGGSLLCLESKADRTDPKKDCMGSEFRSALRPGTEVRTEGEAQKAYPYPNMLSFSSPEALIAYCEKASTTADAFRVLPRDSVQKADEAAEDLRVSHLIKDGLHLFVLVNEGEAGIREQLRIRDYGQLRIFDPWTGSSCIPPLSGSGYTDETLPVTLYLKNNKGASIEEAGYLTLALTLARRRCLVLALDPSVPCDHSVVPAFDSSVSCDRKVMSILDSSAPCDRKAMSILDSSAPCDRKAVSVIPETAAASSHRLVLTDWEVTDGHKIRFDTNTLTSWHEWAAAKGYTGTLTYRCTFDLSARGLYPASFRNVRLDCESVHEIAAVRVNNKSAGVCLFAPYTFDITGLLAEGTNRLEIRVTNALTEHYGEKRLPSGLIGNVCITFS